MNTLKTASLEVRIDEKSATVVVKDLRTGFEWRMQENGPGDIGVKGHAGPWEGIAFADAGEKKAEANDRQVVLSYGKFPCKANVWSPLAYEVRITFAIEADDEISVTVDAISGFGEASLIDSYYPRGFLFPEKCGGDLLLTLGQGCLLRKDFPCDLDHTLPCYVGSAFIMPWWGQIADSGEGLLALVDTPDDSGFRMNTEPGLGHTVHPYWQASLGNFRYPRKIRYRFYEKASVVEMAKTYRRFAESDKSGLTLEEKIKARPNVGKLIGAMMPNLWHEAEVSKFTKQKNHVLRITFDEGLAHYKRLCKDAEIEKSVLHVDGWGRAGYDSMHPDILPPSEGCGGWAGLKNMADTVRDMGHGILLHDNYVDLYENGFHCDDDHSVMDLSGVRPFNDQWNGGPQKWLCPAKTLPFVERNFAELFEHLEIDGVYLDCFTIGHLRECYDQKHLSSRSNTRAAWSKVLEHCQKAHGMFTGSESGNDWSIPVMDFCHTVYPGICPFDLKDKIGGPLGDPIPLYSLVWHDCLVVPAWVNMKKGDPKDALWGMLWGGMPSFRTTSMQPSLREIPFEPELEARFVKALKPMSELHGQIGTQEMTNAEFLNGDRKVQRTTFADGTRVTVNFNDETWSVEKPDGTKSDPASFSWE